MFPGVINRTARLPISGAGSIFLSRSMAPCATALRLAAPGLTMSSSITGTPALATWAAMLAPMTPAPITATELTMSYRLQHGGNALAATDTLRRQRIALAFAFQQRRRLACDA